MDSWLRHLLEPWFRHLLDLWLRHLLDPWLRNFLDSWLRLFFRSLIKKPSESLIKEAFGSLIKAPFGSLIKEPFGSLIKEPFASSVKATFGSFTAKKNYSQKLLSLLKYLQTFVINRPYLKENLNTVYCIIFMHFKHSFKIALIILSWYEFLSFYLEVNHHLNQIWFSYIFHHNHLSF